MCSSDDIKKTLDEIRSDFNKHTVEEMDRYDNIELTQKANYDLICELSQGLQKHEERFNSGHVIMQKLTVADDETNRRIDKTTTKLSELGGAVDHNADQLLKQSGQIEKMTSAIESLARGLAPILDVMHKFTAAMPFFELVGNTVAWGTKRIIPIAVVVATGWAYLTEPWKIFK